MAAEETKVTKDLVAAEKVLEDDHHGLEKVKERILEYLAVQQRVSKQRAYFMSEFEAVTLAWK